MRSLIRYAWLAGALPFAQAQISSDLLSQIHYRYIGPVGNRVIAAASIIPFEEILEEAGGRIVYLQSERDIAASGAVPIYEYTWNHTTLQVLKRDKDVTYLQSAFPEMAHFDFTAINDDGELVGFGPERWIEAIDAAEAAVLRRCSSTKRSRSLMSPATFSN